MTLLRIEWAAMLALIAAFNLDLSGVSAAPSAEVAKRCLHYAYIVYPFKRPGAVRMSGDRQAYFRDCMAKNGDVSVPTPANQSNATGVRTDVSAVQRPPTG
jgi:hypothetical protein